MPTSTAMRSTTGDSVRAVARPRFGGLPLAVGLAILSTVTCEAAFAGGRRAVPPADVAFTRWAPSRDDIDVVDQSPTARLIREVGREGAAEHAWLRLTSRNRPQG